jgi:hypothetical protein
MKYLIGGIIAVVVALLVWGFVWLLQDNSNTCFHWKQTVISVSQNDPKDFPRVLDMYTDNCD